MLIYKLFSRQPSSGLFSVRARAFRTTRKAIMTRTCHVSFFREKIVGRVGKGSSYKNLENSGKSQENLGIFYDVKVVNVLTAPGRETPTTAFLRWKLGGARFREYFED